MAEANGVFTERGYRRRALLPTESASSLLLDYFLGATGLEPVSVDVERVHGVPVPTH